MSLSFFISMNRLVLVIIGSFFACGSALFGQAVDFKRQIAPILSAKCNKCHTGKKSESDKKPKAGLALDTPGGISAGGVIERGNADGSELYLRVILPPSDDEIMPPTDDGAPLSKKEADLIKNWIEQGAPFTAGGGGVGELDADLDAAKVLTMRAGEPSADAMAHLGKLGATITPIAVNSPQYISLEWISTYHKTTDKEIEQMLHLAPNLVDVDLSRTKLTDKGMAHVGKLGRLTHLNLNRTEIGDAGVKQLADLRSLQWLNLYGTQVTDASLPDLAKHKKLKALYIWDTKITAEGADKLRKALPDAKIVMETDAKSSRFDNLDEVDKFDF